MDKNTLNALLLMLAVFVLFMWLSPKEQSSTEGEAEKPSVTAETAVNVSMDSLTTQDREWLVNNIREHGKPVADHPGAYNLAQNGVNLTLDNGVVTGFVTVEGRNIDWADIANADTTKMTVAEQAKAIQTVRNETQAIGRYGKFSRFLSGDNKTVNLENDVLKLQLSSLTGSITRAELKKYDTEYNGDETNRTKHKVVLFEGDKNSFSFELPLPNAVETADLYFTPRQLNDSTVLMALEFGPDTYWGIRYTLAKGDSYLVKMDIVQKNMAPIAQSNNRTLGFSWSQDLRRQETGRMFEERNSAIYYKYAGGSVENLSEAKDDTEERQAKVKWIGFKNQFFSSVMIAGTVFNTADLQSTVLKNSDYLKTFAAQAKISDYDWNSATPAS